MANFELMVKSQFKKNYIEYFSKNYKSPRAISCRFSSISPTGRRSPWKSVWYLFEGYFIDLRSLSSFEKYTIQKNNFYLNGGGLTYSILLYKVLKFHQISSSGMAIILVQKSAEIRTLDFLAYIALFSYLSRMLSVNPRNIRVQNSAI